MGNYKKDILSDPSIEMGRHCCIFTAAHIRRQFLRTEIIVQSIR